MCFRKIADQAGFAYNMQSASATWCMCVYVVFCVLVVEALLKRVSYFERDVAWDCMGKVHITCACVGTETEE